MDNHLNDHPTTDEIILSKAQPDVKEALLLKRSNLTMQLNEVDALIARVNEEYSLKLEQLQSQKKPLEEALQHVEALLRFEGYYVSNIGNADDSRPAVSVATRPSITDAAFDLLEELHKPMHYKDIAAKLQKRNTYIPGKDPAATLLSRMTRDDRFKRTGKRGIYALSTWRVRRSKSKSRKQLLKRKR